MPNQESLRLGARLLALNFRLAELTHEMEQTQIHVRRLEARVEDAQLAQFLGEAPGPSGELREELERTQETLVERREVVDRVRRHQRQARVDYSLARVKERRAERNQPQSE